MADLLIPGRPLVGVSFGGNWSGNITNAVPLLEQVLNSGAVTTHKIESITHFMYPGLTQSSFDTPASQVSGYTGQVVWSMQGWPSGGNVDAAIAGSYNSNYQTIGARLNALTPKAIVRPMWESTLQSGPGPWSAYSIGVLKYQQCFRNLVDNVRLGGFTGSIEFNCESQNGITATALYPGDDWVTHVGIDKYADHGDPTRSSDWPYCWTKFEEPAFAEIAKLAEARGKRIILSEEGCGIRYGDGMPAPGWMTGDNDYYLDQVAKWIQNHDVGAVNFFWNNDTNADGSIKNRFQWYLPATKDKAGPFTRDTVNFPKCTAKRESTTYLAQNLAYLGAPPPPVSVAQVTPLVSQRWRSTRFI